MALTKIERADYNNKGVIGLPDTPQLSTSEMQRKFEELSTDVIIPKHNALIDELEASTGASNIGTTSGNVQSELNTLSTSAHTHTNKALLDTYTQTEADLASAVSDKHSHTNKTVLDSLSKGADGTLNFEGSKVSPTPTWNDVQGKPFSTVDTTLSTTSTNPVTNSAVTTKLNDLDSVKHSHSNKAVLDTYNQSNVDITDAIVKKHTHSNKTVIDALSKDSATGNLMFEGNPISGGGGSGSTVSWQQNTLSGTKIAEITIDGTSTDVYAPTGGGGGATDYSALTSKPQINSIELAGNKTSAQLGLADASTTYTKTEVDGFISSCVPDTRTVNGHQLNASINITASDIGLNNVGNFKAVSTEASQGLTSTEKDNARDNIGAGTYTKPSTGIPQSDLASEVSAKLSKLDSDGKIDYSNVKNKTAIENPSTKSNGQVLTYNGSAWIAQTPQSGSSSASGISYSNTTSGLTSTNVQGAIDEVSNELPTWSSEATSTNGTTVSFTVADTTLAYDLYCKDKLVGISSLVINGSTFTYTVSGASAGDKFKLRIIK